MRQASGLSSMEPMVKLWVLRLLIPLGGHGDFLNTHGFGNDALAHALGLGAWVEDEGDAYDKKVLRAELRRLHQQAEAEAGGLVFSADLSRNLQQLAQLVGLNEVDCQVLAFALCIHTDRLLDEAGDWMGSLSSNKVVHVLAVVLDLPESQLRETLGAQGLLARSGLLSLDRNGMGSLCSKLNVLSDSFADLMLSSNSDPVSLLKGTVSVAPRAELHLHDYVHIQESLDIALPHLRQALATRRCGVNLFLHGQPGTGKSQLARALAAQLGCELFEVASEDEDGDPVSGERRLRAFRAAQSFFSRKQALVVFDEAEDVFNDGEGLFGRKSTAQLRKAWLNRMLEENPVPSIWLSNTVQGLDAAFVRRFDMVFELPVPPKTQRERILQRSCGDLLQPARIRHIAEVSQLAPAVVTKAADVVRTIRHELGEDKVGKAFEQLISNTLQAQGHLPLQAANATRLPEVYDPSFIHADADLHAVAQGLKRSKAGRLCLYGPAGTGKTAYGRWLAEQLDQPLLVKRASDLMGPYVGQSERNIAQAFAEAQHSGAVLMVDEVDSFLQDRRQAHRSWEVTLVNEMLTQMEAFSGVFIASTNLMGQLDPAVLRRFDLKVKFAPLQAEQAWRLLRSHCKALGLPMPRRELRVRLDRLLLVTPGDFATVARQSRFRGLKSALSFVQALEAECALKEGGAPKRLGFV